MKNEHSLNLPSDQECLDAINQQGFVIVKNCVTKRFIDSQRDRWLHRFTKDNVKRKYVSGNLILGESNFMSYSEINTLCMYRYFEFLWNGLEDENAVKLHVDLHKFRNKIQGFDENYGLNYNEENYGIYISTSFYPSRKGMLLGHSDGHRNVPILHYMLPLTFKGIDYHSGGLYCMDKFGKKHDLDAAVEPGDLIFFDGRQEHGVDLIGSETQNLAGRLAVFGIPTHFTVSSKFAVMKRSFDITAKEWASRLGLKKLG